MVMYSYLCVCVGGGGGVRHCVYVFVCVREKEGGREGGREREVQVGKKFTVLTVEQ